MLQLGFMKLLQACGLSQSLSLPRACSETAGKLLLRPGVGSMYISVQQ